MTTVLHITIQTKDTATGKRYRAKRSNYNLYLTDEMTENEMRQWLVTEHKKETDKTISNSLLSAEQNGTSSYPISKRRNPDADWNNE